MRFSIVSSGTQIVSIAPLTATINTSGTATVNVTGLTSGTAVIVAQWFGNLGGTEVTVEYPPPTPTLTPTQEPEPQLPAVCVTTCIYLPLIIKAPASVSQLPPRGPASRPAQAAVWVRSVPLGGAFALVNRPGLS
jgi:hypothetical protein